MRFSFSAEGTPLLVTPWGHGEWGTVRSRGDVLVAEFAHQRHMLRFDAATPSFVSTRCLDGDSVSGVALRPAEQPGEPRPPLLFPPRWWD